jgi:hypothetical protein
VVLFCFQHDYKSCYVGRENNTFKTNDVKDLILKGFKTITPEKWTNFCNHVENKIEPQYWKSDHIIEEIPKIVINLDSDSDGQYSN